MNERWLVRGAVCALFSFAARLTSAQELPALAADAAGSQVVSESDAIQIALAHNPTLAAAEVELRRATLLETSEAHRYGFVLELDAQANRNAVPSLAVSGVTVSQSNGYQLGAELQRHLLWGTDVALRLEGSSQLAQSAFFNPSTNPPQFTLLDLGPGWGALVKLALTQPLLRGAGRDVFEAELQAARVARASQKGASEQAASQLLLDVRTAYWELFYATQALAIQRSSLLVAQARLADAAERVRTGSLAPVDELPFQTNVATLNEDIASAAAEEQRRSNELGRLLGDAAFRTRRADVASPPPTPPPVPGDARERALAASRELAQQRAAVELAQVQARTAAESLRHRLDIDAYVQTQGLGNQAVSPALEQLAGFGAWSAHIGVTYEAPLDGTRRRAEKERAELAVTAARQNLEATTLRVITSLNDAITGTEASRRRLELARATRSVAEQQLSAETDRFRTGGATSLEVREAEDQVRSAALREARAHVDLVQADLIAAHLTGRLLAQALELSP